LHNQVHKDTEIKLWTVICIWHRLLSSDKNSRHRKCSLYWLGYSCDFCISEL